VRAAPHLPTRPLFNTISLALPLLCVAVRAVQGDYKHVRSQPVQVTCSKPLDAVHASAGSVRGGVPHNPTLHSLWISGAVRAAFGLKIGVRGGHEAPLGVGGVVGAN
jgi:hypothetical protein